MQSSKNNVLIQFYVHTIENKANNQMNTPLKREILLYNAEILNLHVHICIILALLI